MVGARRCSGLSAMDLWAMDRWVGVGITADNLFDIGRVMEQTAKPQSSDHYRNLSPPVALAGFALPGKQRPRRDHKFCAGKSWLNSDPWS
jgi:hypothetical protein